MPEAGSATERLAWMEQFAQTRDAASVCRQFAISRATLRKWWLRYEASGPAGLEEAQAASHGRRLTARCLSRRLR